MTRLNPDRFVRLLSGVDSNIQNELAQQEETIFQLLNENLRLESVLWHGLNLTLCITKILTFLRVKVILETTSKTTPTEKYQT